MMGHWVHWVAREGKGEGGRRGVQGFVPSMPAPRPYRC